MYNGTSFAASNSFAQNSQQSSTPNLQYSGGYGLPSGPNTTLQQPVNNTYDLLCNQQMYKNQGSSSSVSSNMYMCCEQQGDAPIWIPESRFLADIERGLKFTDRIETIEITSKDLSPASCCSAVDFLPDLYKTANNTKSTTDSQWYCNSSYGSAKYKEYPSCAQAGSGNCGYRTDRYCSIQKDESVTLNNVENTEYFSPSVYQNYDLIPNVPPQLVEESNEESDIIVEESDEDGTDCSEDQEKHFTATTNCTICNTVYNPLGEQFYHLTGTSPLTMSTQKPVISKVVEVVGNLNGVRSFLCGQCLSLINTIDHLELKLENVKFELYAKLEKASKGINPFNYVNVQNCKKKQYSCFKCKICKKTFSLKHFHHIHMKNHVSKNQFLCEFCGQRFTKPRVFKMHLRRHEAHPAFLVPKLPAFPCKLCKKPFRTKSNLKEHFNYCSGLLPYRCKQANCEKRFPSLTKLKNHVKLKHDKKFSAICSICNIGFIKMSDYKLHMTSHSTEKKFSCTKCYKSYKTRTNLNFHMKFHDKLLPHVCEICSKGFMRKEYLEAHINSHNGIRPFSCQICEKKFVSQKNLDAHMKYHDGSLKKKTCNVCNKVLTTGFEEHLRTHNNLKEFECDCCNMRFNTKGALSKHKIKKHPS